MNSMRGISRTYPRWDWRGDSWLAIINEPPGFDVHSHYPLASPAMFSVLSSAVLMITPEAASAAINADTPGLQNVL
jgi:hypothetical protein